MPAQRVRFTEDTSGVFEDKQQKGKTGRITRKIRHESGRSKHVRTEENGVTTADELVSLLSQEDQTQTHRSTLRYRERQGLTQSSIIGIIH